jgi:hypothetical protein
MPVIGLSAASVALGDNRRSQSPVDAVSQRLNLRPDGNTVTSLNP